MKKILVPLLLAFVLGACGPGQETYRNVVYAEVVRAQVAAGDFAAARNIAELAVQTIDAPPDEVDLSDGTVKVPVELGYEEWAIGAVAVALARAGDAPRAHELIEQIDEIGERVPSYVMLALAQAAAGRRVEAARAANLAREASRHIAGPEDVDWMLAIVAWAQAAAHALGDAQATAAEIDEPAQHALAQALIAGTQAKAGDIAAALATAEVIPFVESRNVEWMPSLAVRILAIDPFEAIDEAIFHGEMPARLWALLAVARAQVAMRDAMGAKQTLELALNSVDSLQNDKARAQGFLAIGLLQARAGDEMAARETFELAEQASPPLLESEPGTPYLLLAAFRVANGNLTETRRILDMMAADENRAAVLKSIAMALADGSDFETARDALREMRPIGMNPDRFDVSFFFSRLAAVHAGAGNRTAAQAAATRALAEAKAITDGDNLNLALSFAAVAQARAGDIEGALQTAGEIRTVHSESTTILLAPEP